MLQDRLGSSSHSEIFSKEYKRVTRTLPYCPMELFVTSLHSSQLINAKKLNFQVFRDSYMGIHKKSYLITFDRHTFQGLHIPKKVVVYRRPFNLANMHSFESICHILSLENFWQCEVNFNKSLEKLF